MSVKQIGVKQTDGTYQYQPIGANASNIDIDATHTLADKATAWDAKVDAETGKGLSTNDFTTAEKTKLDSIDSGAEANTIESISVNGTEVTPVDKNVNIEYEFPTDVAPINHASVDGTYGLASTTEYGHVKFGDTAGTAVEGNDARLSNARNPVAHAANDSTYGLASSALYGHAKVVSGAVDNQDSAAAASASSVYNGLAGKGDNIDYDTDTQELSLKSGNTVIATVTVEGGGTAKSSLTVTVDDSSLYNQTITCVIPNGESLSGTVSASGIATFNLKYVGTYTITCGGYSTTVENAALGSLLNATIHVGKAVLTINTTTAAWYSSTATVSKSGTTVGTVTLTNGTGSITLYETGTYTVTLQSKSSNVTISALDTTASVTINDLELVAWSSGTDEQIAAMVGAYYDGSITLSDVQSVWSVGQSRTMSLSAMSATGVGESHRAQTVELVIIDFDHDTLTTPINGKTKALITVNQKNCLRDANVADDGGSGNTEHGYINSSNTNAGGWTNCARRTWCNNVYYNAIPSTIKNEIKQVNKLTSAGNQSSTINTDADYVWLLSEIEIFGTASNSKSGEGTRYSWFAQADSNRYKLPKWYSSAVSDIWWERSPYGSNASAFCFVNSNGSAGSGGASDARGLAPAFCL